MSRNRNFKETIGIGLDIAQLIAKDGFSLTQASKEYSIHSNTGHTYVQSAYEHYLLSVQKNPQDKILRSNLKTCREALKLIDKRNRKIAIYY